MKRSEFLRLAVVAPWWLRHAVAGGGTGSLPDPRPAAVAWLLKQQSADGAWRSDTYGAFRDGRVLTPVVLRALAREKVVTTTNQHGRHMLLDLRATPCQRGGRWLLDHRDTLFDEYPVHLASAILEAAPSILGLEPLAILAKERLLALQCPRTGGWSYATTAPPATGPLPPMQQANLAATVMALDGLRAAGVPASEERNQKILPFLHGCQNFGDTSFDDGGFFQMPDDPARNKAGIAGTDAAGRTRYRSYASATADGLRALRLCGEGAESPRVKAAVSWLQRFPDRTPADLKYYTARSLAKAGCLPAATAHQLAAEQQPDGSWRNPAGEMREDCPVVATALVLEALAASP